MTTVVLADDQRVVREGLATLLGLLPHIEVLGTASDGEEAIALVERLRPDVVLMDLRMPVVAGIGATKQIKQALPSTQVVVLTSHAGPLLRQSTAAAGAYATLSKDCAPVVIRDTVFHAWRYKVGLEQAQRLSTE